MIRWVCQDAYEAVGEGPNAGFGRQKRIAVVGLSDNPARPSFHVTREMQRMGYKVIPVNPNVTDVLGERAYPDLAAVRESFEVVQVFRRSEHAPEVARQAAWVAREKEVRVFWLQEGVLSDEAVAIAAAAGLDVVADRCTYKEAQRLRAARDG